MGECKLPTTVIDGKEWILLNHIDKIITVRACSIEKNNKRVSEPSGHRFDECKAEGSVKCRPRPYKINL